MKNTKNDKGFIAAIWLIVPLFVGAIGFTGWLVWQKQHDNSTDAERAKPSTSQTKSNTETQPSNDVPRVKKPPTPAGYNTYENKELGFSFIYPTAFGVNATAPNPEHNSTDSLTINKAPTLKAADNDDMFDMYTYSSADAVVSYAGSPLIQLQGNIWAIVESSARDAAVQYKKGDAYKEVTGQVPASQLNDSLLVYTLKNVDGSTTHYRIAFVSNNKLHVLRLPEFSEDSYAASLGDIASYNQMVKNVLDGIRPL